MARTAEEWKELEDALARSRGPPPKPPPGPEIEPELESVGEPEAEAAPAAEAEAEAEAGAVPAAEAEAEAEAGAMVVRDAEALDEDSDAESSSSDFEDPWEEDRRVWLGLRDECKGFVDNETYHLLQKECDSKYCDRRCVSQIDHAQIYTVEDFRRLHERDWWMLGVKDPKARRLLRGTDRQIEAFLEAMEITKPRRREGEQCVRCEKYLSLEEPVVECMVCEDIPVFCFQCAAQDAREAQNKEEPVAAQLPSRRAGRQVLPKEAPVPDWIIQQITQNPAAVARNKCSPLHEKQRFSCLEKRDEVHAIAAFDELVQDNKDGEVHIDDMFALMRKDGRLDLADFVKQVFQRMEHGNLRHNCGEDMFIDKVCAMRAKKMYSVKQRFMLKTMLEYNEKYAKHKARRAIERTSLVASKAMEKAEKKLCKIKDAAREAPAEESEKLSEQIRTAEDALADAAKAAAEAAAEVDRMKETNGEKQVPVLEDQTWSGID